MKNWLLRREDNTVENNKTRKSWKALVHQPLSYCSKSQSGHSGQVLRTKRWSFYWQPLWFFILFLLDLRFRISHSFSLASWNQLQKATQSPEQISNLSFFFQKSCFYSKYEFPHWDLRYAAYVLHQLHCLIKIIQLLTFG